MKKVNMNDVAKQAEVSLTTVSRVINNSGYVAEEKRKRVENAIRETGYLLPIQPEKPAHMENLIGLILRKISVNIFYDQLSSALLQEADKVGYSMVAMYSNGDLCNDNLRGYVEKLLKYKVSGIVICGFGDEYLSESLRELLQECGIPIVFVERTAGCYGFNRVLVDNSLGTYYATRYLIQKKHGRLLYIGFDKKGSVEKSRTKGFLHAVQEAGYADSQYSIYSCPDSSVASGYAAMKWALEKQADITGVVAYFDGYAAGAMQYLYEIGRKVPNDIEIIGHDDTYAPNLAPPISSVRMPFEEMGSAAVNMILENQGNTMDFFAKTVSLEPKLILRGGNAQAVFL
ncbi:HTH-type transcriptional regulator DegA [Caprobacter fermentans]|uniref:HTH-type transcriptional regulator DegA n=1 Tax=Caproicibacter fermentans TaxID=2576756 RepID=A0A6N8I4L8_9FIRM|nr:LacI family DNA-binding transcriptional regulator [Caproicibacter fermentans]MVB12443.1 HTH-type transcriptional regulator DegA [Caproicibacter fermentans]